jgi:oligopeptide transport system permease protein
VFVVIFVITLASAWRTELDGLGVSREVLLYVLVGAVSWLTMARVVRGQVLQIAKAEFVLAARVSGASATRIVLTHVVPNVLPVVVVYLTLSVPSILLTEAFLSFLGLGIEPPRVSWGLLASDAAEAINPLRVPWWLVVFPSLAMGLVLLALNVLGDGLRDALDPRETPGGAGGRA